MHHRSVEAGVSASWYWGGFGHAGGHDEAQNSSCLEAPLPSASRQTETSHTQNDSEAGAAGSGRFSLMGFIFISPSVTLLIPAIKCPHFIQDSKKKALKMKPQLHSLLKTTHLIIMIHYEVELIKVDRQQALRTVKVSPSVLKSHSDQLLICFKSVLLLFIIKSKTCDFLGPGFCRAELIRGQLSSVCPPSPSKQLLARQQVALNCVCELFWGLRGLWLPCLSHCSKGDGGGGALVRKAITCSLKEQMESFCSSLPPFFLQPILMIRLSPNIQLLSWEFPPRAALRRTCVCVLGGLCCFGFFLISASYQYECAHITFKDALPFCIGSHWRH